MSKSISSSVTLKLLVDSKRGVVLFAEASQNVAAFISGVLSRPDSAVALLQQRQGAAAPATVSSANLRSIMQDHLKEKPLYCCGEGCEFEYSDDPAAVCSHCSGHMDERMEYVAPPPPAEDTVTIIMDDLEMMPVGAASFVTLFKNLRVRDVDADALERKVVRLGVDEVIKVVNASLQSEQVLTDVFLKAESVKGEIEGGFLLV